MKNFVERSCRECGGTIKLIARVGRTWQYKGALLEVPGNFEIPTCTRCGEEYINPELAESLDKVLSIQYEERLSAAFDGAIKILRRHCSQRALERKLGLSQGYISKILTGKKTPSATLVGSVMLIARKPKERLEELDLNWSNFPPTWMVANENSKARQ